MSIETITYILLAAVVLVIYLWYKSSRPFYDIPQCDKDSSKLEEDIAAIRRLLEELLKRKE